MIYKIECIRHALEPKTFDLELLQKVTIIVLTMWCFACSSALLLQMGITFIATGQHKGFSLILKCKN